MSTAREIAPVGVFNLYDDCFLTWNVDCLITGKHWVGEIDGYMEDSFHVSTEIEVDGQVKKVHFRMDDHAPREFHEPWYEAALKRRSAILVGTYTYKSEWGLPTVPSLKKKVADLRKHSISGAKIPIVLLMLQSHKEDRQVAKEDIEATIKELGNGELSDPIQFFELGATAEKEHALKVRMDTLRFLDKHGVFDGLNKSGMVDLDPKPAGKKPSRCSIM
eukprot:TRINITY_DN12648_c0_g1_i1.p2 TRINITY_DN12648_c0_g1~~TRINITY_DN12648_c0_g1_i1.p2  ORF type:complete len:219 (-),score=33.58 TRINITY_DN12648_c0_g1_i1:153-809(-)